QAAVDIMENQGKSLADRPRMVATGDILSGEFNIAFAPVRKGFVECRALHAHLQPKAAEAYQPLQIYAKNVVLDILDVLSHTTWRTIYAATTITRVSCEKNTSTSATDPEVIEVNQPVRMIGAILRPGAQLVDSIPWLRYLPWYSQDLRWWFEHEARRCNVDIGPALAKYMLESVHLYGLSETERAFLATAFLEICGSYQGQTSATICTVFMAAACFPQEHAKVQAELDAVVRRHR
ncbi:uncharacterized protein EDB91DRAFT_1034130, partial [Suillus paluster]|uniref:uncharacterized protein n=1 Tax=Suillus paluster TaxID=48578 RepID=UPI001B869167